MHTISVQQDSGGPCGVTGIAFNGKQREFIAACDTKGTNSLTHLLTYSLTHSLTHLLTHSLTHLRTYSPTLSCRLNPYLAVELVFVE